MSAQSRQNWRCTVCTNETADALASLSRWVDESPANKTRDKEAATWARVAKVAEECGEVIAAWSGATGRNPRKGVTHLSHDVVRELLDVAVAALCAVEHFAGNDGGSVDMLAEHVTGLVERAWPDIGRHLWPSAHVRYLCGRGDHSACIVPSQPTGGAS